MQLIDWRGRYQDCWEEEAVAAPDLAVASMVHAEISHPPTPAPAQFGQPELYSSPLLAVSVQVKKDSTKARDMGYRSTCSDEDDDNGDAGRAEATSATTASYSAEWVPTTHGPIWFGTIG